jgi:O-antigen/teichoic acid export membrane protein
VRERIERSVVWIVGSRGVVQVATWISTLLVARLLSPADYGLIAMAGVWTAMIAVLAELGLGAAIVQFPEPTEGELNACFWLTIGVSGAGYLALCLAAPAIAAWFAAPMLADVLYVLGLILPFVALRVIPDSLLRKRLEFDRISKGEILAAIATMPVVLGLAALGAGVWALVAGALVTTLVQATVAFWFVRWVPGVRLGTQRLAVILRYSLHTLGGRMLWALYTEIDAIALGKITGSTALGHYSMAKQLALLPVEKICSIVIQIAVPVLAELQDERDRMRQVFLRSVRLVTLITFPTSAGLAIVAPEIVPLILTERWSAVVPLLQVFALFAATRSVAVLMPPVLMARYQTGFLLRYNAALLVTMTTAVVTGALVDGVHGAALMLVTAYPVVTAWMVLRTCRETRASPRELLLEMQSPIVGSFATIVTVWAVRYLGSGGLAQLAAEVALGAVVYGAVVLALGGRSADELREAVVRGLHWLQRLDTLRRAALRTPASGAGDVAPQALRGSAPEDTPPPR